MQSRARRWTKRSSCLALASALFLVLVSAGLGRSQTRSGTEHFTKALDAYFGDQPYLAIVHLHDSMARGDAAQLREASLYVMGQAFSATHLYEKAEDSLGALLMQFPRGQFAPVAIRELARIFFNLHEYGAVVNLEQTYRGRIPEQAFPIEFWYLLGQSNYMLGRKDQARAPLSRVPPGTAFYPFARFTLAQVEFSANRPDSALAALSEVASSTVAPELLRERAARVSGMILYQQKRYSESAQAYRTISTSSRLYGQSRVDLALAAEAAGDSDAAQQAFSDAMQHADDDLIRTEARVAVGKFLNRREKGGAARALFEQALADLRTRESKLHQAVDVDSEFRQTFAELVTFARQSSAVPRSQRLAEDLELVRGALSSMGVSYDRPPSPPVEKMTPQTYLFSLLQSRYHNPQIIETFVELSVEIEDLRKQTNELASAIRGQSWPMDVTLGEVPEEASTLTHQVIWLAFAHFDLVTRFYDALSLNEKVDTQAAGDAKRRALVGTIETLRLILYGNRAIPSLQSLMGMMDATRQSIESGKLPGMMAQKVREGFLQEWQSDRDSLTYVVENLDLKQRQMLSAISGVPLRSRNVNLPVLSTMMEWLTVLEQLVSKNQNIALEKKERPWHLAGKSEEVAATLASLSSEIDAMNERGIAVVREVARDLVAKESYRHSLVVAQAEEGIADALFQERAGR